MSTFPTQRVGLAVDPELRSLDFASMYAPQRVAAMIRSALLEAGLGSRDPERPLADLIEPGATVLLKPNFVLHENEGDGGQECLYTQPEFVAAAAAEVALARPARIVVGDAPINLCDWDALVTPAVEERIRAAAGDVPVEFFDFRRMTLSLGMMKSDLHDAVRGTDHYALFDLGPDSVLEEISTPDAPFRVGNYDPDALARTHHPERHQFLLCKEAFESDVVISLPKLKTHCKVGMTGSLKNLVGMNGNKDFLPHHRVGAANAGGDCYPDHSLLKSVAERLEDAANRRIGQSTHPLWRHFGRAAKLVARGSGGRMAASWHGNDTCWRMVLDLNRILFYGRSDGTMSDELQRTFYSLTDAILCGQGEGPLKPDPLPVGAVTFAASPLAAEIVHAGLLGLDPDRMELIRVAAERFRWPLSEGPVTPEVHIDGRVLDADAVAEAFGVPAIPARGWVGHIERTSPATPRAAAG